MGGTDVGKVVWRKSFRSSGQGDVCVELATISSLVAVVTARTPPAPSSC
ncbi:DUF397 domain-containing protein [Actinomadura monticuli]